MPAFGFGNVGGAVADETTAGFPTSGLVALYKCDERSGDKLYDATGNLQPITLATGSALDAVAADCYVTDTTGYLAAITGRPAIVVMGCEIITPAASGGALTHNIIHRNTGATNGALLLAVNEITTTSRFRIYVGLRTSLDAAPAADVSINSGADFTLAPSTHYQIVVRVDLGDATPHAVFSVRSGASGPWRTLKVNGGTAGTHLLSSAVAVRLLNSETAAVGWNGKIFSAFACVDDIPLSSAQVAMERPSITNIQNILGTTYSRFWNFGIGTGTKCREVITNTYDTIAGTVAWAGSLSGCTQVALRQGLPYYGKAGVALGGQDGFGAMGGGGASASNTSQIIASTDGWTMQATLRVGNHLPAAEQLLASFYGPDSAGSIPAALTALPGVHLTLSAAGVITAKCNAINGTGERASSATIGPGTAVAANGLFTTYTITCSDAGVMTMYRQASGDTSVTTVGVLGTTNTQFRATRADRAGVGRAAMDGDAIVGFLATWNRPLTTAEMVQCHNMALSRMTGQELYVASASTMLGNGSELYPYSDTLPAVRVHQPNQICNWGTGSYTRFNQSASSTNSSSSTNITWRGTGSPTFVGGAGTGDYSTILQGGTWAFSNIVWDAADTNFYAMMVSEDVTSVSFTSCEWKRGYQEPEPGNTATGSGLTSRAGLTTIINCTATDNDEHGVYLRIVGEDAVDQRCIIDGLTVTGGGEDGLKMTNEGAYGARWVNCIINRVKVTGGKNQLYLLGLSDSVVTNFLLLDQTSALSDIAPLYLGNVQGFTGETLVSDYPLVNVTVANGTISNTNTRGVWIKGDLASGSVTLHNIVCKDCADDYNDDTTAGTVTISHCAGDTAGDPFPAGTGMIPAATIAFTNAAGGDYTLTEASDGYGDGINLTGLSDEAEETFAGVARPATGAWNMGAY